MSNAVQSALQTVLQGLPQFADHPEGVTRGDYSILESQDLDVMIVIEPGVFGSGDAGACQITRTWQIPFNIFCRYTGDITTLADFSTFRDAVIDRLDSYPTLNGQDNITLARLSAEGDPTEVKDRTGGGPFFTMQTLQAEIIERVTLSGGEYA